jgi:hypothetical protein
VSPIVSPSPCALSRNGRPAVVKAQIQERQRDANRLHKALEDAGIKSWREAGRGQTLGSAA